MQKSDRAQLAVAYWHSFLRELAGARIAFAEWAVLTEEDDRKKFERIAFSHFTAAKRHAKLHPPGWCDIATALTAITRDGRHILETVFRRGDPLDCAFADDVLILNDRLNRVWTVAALRARSLGAQGLVSPAEFQTAMDCVMTEVP